MNALSLLTVRPFGLPLPVIILSLGPFCKTEYCGWVVARLISQDLIRSHVINMIQDIQTSKLDMSVQFSMMSRAEQQETSHSKI